MNNWYKKSKKIKPKKDESYGWTCVIVPDDIKEKILGFAKKIPERELYVEVGENGHSHGIEKDSHITALYGIITKNVKDVESALKDHKGGKIKLGKIDVFENEKYDVLKINIISPSLHRINSSLTECLDNVNEFPSYKPHITIAYLKCGNGRKYVGDKFRGLSFDFDEIVFEDKNDKKYFVKLDCD